ncbi:flagellar hook-basal body complex protein FliE [Motiliproteus sediminis]|uniref:flagellar hook-basal body complex protein FliE n=1 Tax=Motiliproteus sediminis TaxID=1468178 RepID=UPI001AEFC5AD|nr:flagellar hook-basal body complex protein FliE [Motiliproteus sediminis]
MTDRVDIQNVLSQMRALQAQASGAVRPMAGPEAAEGPSGGSFGDLLKTAIDKVSETQNEAKNLSLALERGDPNVDLPQVMIGLQKASVSFQAMVQVRNRLVAAYEDISKMPI